MTPKQPISQLQSIILIHLDHYEISTITELAKKLKVPRPSVSRAFTTLKNDRLVVKSNKLWILTQAGQELARKSEEELRAQTAQFVEATNRSFARIQQTMPILLGLTDDRIANTHRAMLKSQEQQAMLQPKFEALQASIERIVSSQLQFPEYNKMMFPSALSQVSLDRIANTKQKFAELAKMIQPSPFSLNTQQAIESFTNSQRIATEMIQRISSIAAPTQMFKELSLSNIGISHILDEIRKLGTSRILDDSFSTVALLEHVETISQTHSRYFQDSIAQLPALTSASIPNLNIVAPTQTTLTFVQTVEDIVNTETEDNHARIIEGHWQDRAAQFDGMLKALDPKYVRKWQGAWATLFSPSPDRLSQAAHSGRELLMQVLADLAPDSAFTSDEMQQYSHNKGITRKMRIRRILGSKSESAVEWAESIAKGSDAMYDRLTGISHDRSSQPTVTEQQVASALVILAELLMSIVGQYR